MCVFVCYHVFFKNSISKMAENTVGYHMCTIINPLCSLALFYIHCKSSKVLENQGQILAGFKFSIHTGIT